MSGDRCVGAKTALKRWTYSENVEISTQINLKINKHTVVFLE